MKTGLSLQSDREALNVCGAEARSAHLHTGLRHSVPPSPSLSLTDTTK